MAVNVDGLVGAMTDAGRGLGGEIWSQMQGFAIPELKKIAIQVEAIAEHAHEITLETAQALLRMQVNAAVAVIVAMTELTLLAVEQAINAILDAVRDLVNGVVGIPLV